MSEVCELVVGLEVVVLVEVLVVDVVLDEVVELAAVVVSYAIGFDERPFSDMHPDRGYSPYL